MKLKLLLIASLAHFLMISQTTTFNLNNPMFIKTGDGYYVYGNMDNNFTLTKYDLKLNKLNEYTKDIRDFKFKAPFVKKFPDYIQLIFLKKMLPAKGAVIVLDTNLNVIDEREFGPEDYKDWNSYSISANKDKFYTSFDFEDEKTLKWRHIYYKDKIAVFLDGKIMFGKANHEKVFTYYDKLNMVDIPNADKISDFGFESIGNRLFFYAKTDDDYLKSHPNNWGGRLKFLTGDLLVGEIDQIKNTIKYVTNLSTLDLGKDFSFNKFSYDPTSGKMMVVGAYLDKTKFEKLRENEESEQAGWFMAAIDEHGIIGKKCIVKNEEVIFENFNKNLQNNRFTTIRGIEKTSSGYSVLAEVNFKFDQRIDQTSTLGIFQLLGFYKYELSEDLKLEKSKFYPAKAWNKNHFEDAGKSNIFDSNACRQPSFCISNANQSCVIYSYGKNFLSYKDEKEYSFIQELSEGDFSGHDFAIQNPNLVLFKERPYKNPETTFFYHFDEKNYHMVQWKKKAIIFELKSY